LEKRSLKKPELAQRKKRMPKKGFRKQKIKEKMNARKRGQKMHVRKSEREEHVAASRGPMGHGQTIKTALERGAVGKRGEKRHGVSGRELKENAGGEPGGGKSGTRGNAAKKKRNQDAGDRCHK